MTRRATVAVTIAALVCAAISGVGATQGPAAVTVAFSLPDATGLVEGIAYRPKTGAYYFGDVHHRAVWRRAPDGTVTRFTAPDERLLGVFRVIVDGPRGALWAAMGALPHMAGFTAAQKGIGGIAEIGLERGTIRRVVPAPKNGGDHLLGDMVLLATDHRRRAARRALRDDRCDAGHGRRRCLRRHRGWRVGSLRAPQGGHLPARRAGPPRPPTSGEMDLSRCFPPPRPRATSTGRSTASGPHVALSGAGGMVMTRLGIALTVGLVALGTRLDAGAPARIDDDFVIRGCVTDANAPSVIAPASLVWSRSDIMLAAAEAREDAVPIAGRVFYWLEDDEDLSRYRGQRVEVQGELEDFEKGKVEIDRHDKYTKITLDLDGKKQEARVPNGWLNPAAAKHDEEFQIVARRMDVKKVKVLGACVGGS